MLQWPINKDRGGKKGMAGGTSGVRRSCQPLRLILSCNEDDEYMGFGMMMMSVVGLGWEKVSDDDGNMKIGIVLKTVSRGGVAEDLGCIYQAGHTLEYHL
jgi:hypothetical protein